MQVNTHRSALLVVVQLQSLVLHNWLVQYSFAQSAQRASSPILRALRASHHLKIYLRVARRHAPNLCRAKSAMLDIHRAQQQALEMG